MAHSFQETTKTGGFANEEIFKCIKMNRYILSRMQLCQIVLCLSFERCLLLKERICSFPYRVDTFSEGSLCTMKQTEVTEVYSLVEMAGKSNRRFL